MLDVTRHVVLCPKNDPESLQILALCDSFATPTVISDQPHGATLVNEKKLRDRLAHANPTGNTVVIIEIPGLAEEDALRKAGYTVQIVDHHAYGKLDRTRPDSSLEQFIAYFQITDDDLREHGFDPLMIRGVGCIDRGFLWELPRAGFSPADAAKARQYYEHLARSLVRDNAPTSEELQTIWNNRQERDGILILSQGHVTRAGIRDGLSFILAQHYPDAEPPVIIVQHDKIVAQGIHCGEKLLATFGGYLFGTEKCWGFQGSPDSLPAVADVLAAMR